MTRDEEKLRLKQLRQRLEVAPIDWKANHMPEKCELVAIDRAAMQKDPVHELQATLHTQNHEAIFFLTAAHGDISFLLALLDRATAKIRELMSSGQPEPKNYATHCAMVCGEPAFKKYLQECHALETATDEAVAARVRSILDIRSRKELNENDEKAKAWLALRRRYENWRKHG